MEVNIPKLKGLMAEKGFSIRKLASAANMAESTLCRKLAGAGKGLTVAEMHSIVEALDMDGKTAQFIFLFQNSRKREF